MGCFGGGLPDHRNTISNRITARDNDRIWLTADDAAPANLSTMVFGMADYREMLRRRFDQFGEGWAKMAR